MREHNETKKSENETSPKENEEIKPAAYLRAMKVHLRNGNPKEAFCLLQQASVRFPQEPPILSFYGCLQALVDKKYRSGVETCKKAIMLLKGKTLAEKEALYPVFYLNLGKAYLAAGKKRDAIVAFQEGLKHDNSHYELTRELRGMGVRKPPAVTFLARSNPINKYMGLFLNKKSETGKKGMKTRSS